MTCIGCFHPLKQAYTKRIVTQKWRLANIILDSPLRAEKGLKGSKKLVNDNVIIMGSTTMRKYESEEWKLWGEVVAVKEHAQKASEKIH